MITTCIGCSIPATEGRRFVVEAMPFCRERAYCPNCHARHQRRFFQTGLALDALLGVLGLAFVLHDPASRFGQCALNLFLIQLFLIIATVPHELAHAFVARWCGLRVEKLLLGFGSPLWGGRLLGFEVEVKQIPYGGHTRTEAGPGGTALWRYFLFHLAGPLASLALGVGAWFAAGANRGGALDLTTRVSPWWLFSIACSTLVVHHLFPYIKTTVGGRAPSDGLALLQILFQRRPPSVTPVRDAPNVQEVNFARKFSRRFSVSVFASGALVCILCALMVGRAAFGSTFGIALWIAAGLFLALGGTFAWGAYWMHRKPWQSQPHHGLAPLTRHSEVVWDFRAEVNARSFWPPDLDFDQAQARVEQARHAGDVAGISAFLDEAIRWAPDNVALLAWKGQVLGWAGRHAEAAEQFSLILENGDLGLSLRATFLAEHVRALLRDGQTQSARALCATFVKEPGLLPEKLYLLDTVAALPIEESRPNLLADAEFWSGQALALQPENLSLKATRGAVLAGLGRDDEAVPLLSEVHARSEIDADKGLAALCLARLAEDAGNSRAAARLSRQAQLLHPAPAPIKRP